MLATAFTRSLISSKGSANQSAVYGLIDKNVKNRKTYFYVISKK